MFFRDNWSFRNKFLQIDVNEIFNIFDSYFGLKNIPSQKKADSVLN